MAFKRPEPIGDGHSAKPANDIEKQKDQIGFTHPNLHRKINPHSQYKPETAPRGYHLSINGLNSIRTTEIHMHDEESEYEETP